MIGQKPSREMLAAACLFMVLAAPASAVELPVAGGVTMATVPKRTVVFVDHLGPYWGIAGKLQAVRNYMQAHHLSGPLLIRYAADPTRAGGSVIGMKIGFALDGEHTPVAPFKKETWAPESMATTRVPAGSASLVAACRRIRAWSSSRDFVPTGSVIELFEGSADGGANDGRTMIQMPMLPVESIKPESDDDASERPAAQERAPGPSRTQSQASPPKPPVSAKEIEIDGGLERLALDPPAVEEVPATPIKTSPPSSRPTTSAPTTDSPATPRPNMRPAPPQRTPTKAFGNPVAKALVPRPPEVKAPPETETGSLAKRLIPPAGSLDSESRAWLGEVVLRVRAISRGTKRLYGDEGHSIIGLADSVASRYARLYGQSHLESKSGAKPSGPANAALSKRRTAITRDLDRFMAILGSKSLSVAETKIRFRRIIRRAADATDAMLVGNEFAD